jgi:hypothetical protein
MALVDIRTRYVIRLADGSYYVEKLAKGILRTTREISEAHRFVTRFFAVGAMQEDIAFSHAVIQDYRPEA